MQRVSILAVMILAACAGNADAQLMFQTTLEKYDHPKSEWEQWKRTKDGDYIEYTDGTNVLFYFEATEVGDHELKVRSLSYNGFTPKPQERVIRHVFDQADPTFGEPTSSTEDKLKLGDQEFEARRDDWLAPDKSPVKQVWFSADAPFDGMLKYQQYTLGKPSAERVASRFRLGDKTFGKVEDKPAKKDTLDSKDPAPTTPKPDEPPDDKPEVETRLWTSANGKDKIEASLVKANATSVVLKRTSDGKEFTLPVRQLSKADRDYLQQLRKVQK